MGNDWSWPFNSQFISIIKSISADRAEYGLLNNEIQLLLTNTLNVPFFWNITLRRCMRCHDDCKPLNCHETSGTDYSRDEALHRIQQNPHLHSCVNLKTFKLPRILKCVTFFLQQCNERWINFRSTSHLAATLNALIVSFHLWRFWFTRQRVTTYKNIINQLIFFLTENLYMFWRYKYPSKFHLNFPAVRKFNLLKPSRNFTYHQVLTFKNSTLWSHGICVFCVDLGKNSKFCFTQRWKIGFYIRGGECLQRGTEWVLIKHTFRL
jgi:hypothetical protein